MTEKKKEVPAPQATPPVAYFSHTADQVLAELQSSPRGLGTEEAARRLVQYGPNLIAQERGVPLWRKFVANLTNFFAILLWVAAALSFLTGGNESGVAIIAVILINAFFSFFQEYRAEQAVAALQRLLPAIAKVRRNGEVTQVPAADLVPGDILVLEEGDNISADARLLQEFDLRTNNSTLTGESDPVRKTAETVREDGLVWTQMPNLVFAGTSVASGSAAAAVIATGMNTEFGHIAHLTQSVKAELSPLQIQIGRIARTVTQLSVVMGAIFFFVGIFLAHLTLKDGAIFAIGIVLANVPEGLLPTVSLALATGVQRLVKRNALVKKLSSVETLGSATVICTDKTGTLTQNEMTVREVWVGGQALEVTGIGYEPKGKFVADGRTVTLADSPDLSWLVRAAAFCNNARLLSPDSDQPKWGILGDPTEGALIVAAAKAGFDTERELKALPRIHLLPFESRRKRMSVIHQAREATVGLQPNTLIAFAKGAPKEVLSLCTRILVNGAPRPITEAERATIMGENDRFAAAGLRVLGLAFRNLTPSPSSIRGGEGGEVEYTPDNVERDLTFVGLMAMQDPPRPEVATAVENAHTAGIRVIMITGDYGLTAESIARKIGIVQSPRPRIVTGGDLDTMDDAALKQLLSDPIEVIFARVAPEHKLRVVAAFRELGEIVAVTGDGVNDAPALKRADIGVAMGKAGTDVAKEAAAMILTDDNFASIVAAVEEGRAVYDNIRKFVTYIFAHLAGEAVPYILFALFNLPLPLTALQILAIDLGTETLPALALGTEKPEPDVMRRPPRKRSEKLLNAATLIRGYFFLGILLSIGSMFGYFWQLYRSGWQWGMTGDNSPLFATGSLFQREAATMTFLGIIIMQVANVFACRTERVSVFRVGFFSNRMVFSGIVFELIFAAILIYVPFFQGIFGTAPVGLEGWLVLFAFTPMVFFAEEARKWFGRHIVSRPGKEKQR